MINISSYHMLKVLNQKVCDFSQFGMMIVNDATGLAKIGESSQNDRGNILWSFLEISSTLSQKESEFVSSQERRPTFQKIITEIFHSLNNEGECVIPVGPSYIYNRPDFDIQRSPPQMKSTPYICDCSQNWQIHRQWWSITFPSSWRR